MNLFGKRLVSGKAIGAQEDLARKLNRVFDILENIEGVGGARVTKDGIDWRVSMDLSGANSPASQSISALASKCWDISLSGNTLTLADCIWMRGKLTFWADSASVELAQSSYVWVSAKISTLDNTCTLVQGTTLASVTCGDQTNRDTFVLIPRWKLSWSEAEGWKPALDLRTLAPAIISV
jgi:hypothetical protein